jgi:hypothetical protein
LADLPLVLEIEPSAASAALIIFHAFTSPQSCL